MTGSLSPLVISGAPRSGTSLLYNLFDGHPDVAWLGDEGFLFEYVHDLGNDACLLLDAVPCDIEALVHGLRDKQVIPPLHEPYEQSIERGSVSEVVVRWDWSEDAFRKALASGRPADIDALWRWLAGACVAGLRQVPRRFGCMKSPDFGKSAEAALRWCADARTIVIVRDPLYSLDSLKRSRELRGEKLLSWPLLALQTERFRRLHDIIRHADTGRMHVIRYETLVSAPEETMRALADWIGIEYRDSLLEPTMHGQSWPGISSFAPTDGIQDAPQRRAIQVLTDAEQSFIRGALSDLRAAFGYD